MDLDNTLNSFSERVREIDRAEAGAWIMCNIRKPWIFDYRQESMLKEPDQIGKCAIKDDVLAQGDDKRKVG